MPSLDTSKSLQSNSDSSGSVIHVIHNCRKLPLVISKAQPMHHSTQIREPLTAGDTERFQHNEKPKSCHKLGVRCAHQH
eukprot:18023-Heterococcus_DN1.PRE.7